MACDFSGYYNLLEAGILIADNDFRIRFMNDWLKNRLESDKQCAKTLPELFGHRNADFICSVIQGVIKYQTTRILSQSFHSWIIPLTDRRFPDGLMRQGGVVSPFPISKEHQKIALIQIRDDSDTVLRTEHLQKIRNDLIEKSRMLEQLNARLEKEIEERKQSEKEKESIRNQLIQSQKLEIVGTLADGISNDFNNILYAIVGFTEVVMDDLPKESAAYANLSEVLKASDRARDILRCLIDFSRKKKVVKNSVKLQYILKEGLRLAKSWLPKTIEIIDRISEDCQRVEANPNQINQALINLLNNSSRAMSGRQGQLTIELDNIAFNEEQAGFPDSIGPGVYVMLKISDTGCGMDPKTVRRIFDPYFSDKPDVEGSGLGLTIVRAIVSTHGGFIRVISQPNAGTVFEIFFPPVQQTDAESDYPDPLDK